MVRMTRLGFAVIAIVTWTGSVSWAQNMQQQPTTRTTTQSQGGNTGFDPAPQLGGSSNTVTGLGGGMRIDRSSRTTANNPLSMRGLNVLSGDASQQGQTAITGRQLGGSGTIPGFGAGGQGGRSGLSNQNRRQNENRAQYSTRIAFPTAPASASSSTNAGFDTVASLQGGLADLPQSSIHAMFENGTIVLRGSVASESDRRVAERIAKLEPGVDRVKNELKVAAAANSP